MSHVDLNICVMVSLDTFESKFMSETMQIGFPNPRIGSIWLKSISNTPLKLESVKVKPS